jgi:hypothetical protein
MTSLILISRLRSRYWPAWCSAFGLIAVRRARSIHDYVPESQRTQDYDAGRIRYFMDELHAGRAIQPIVVDAGPLPTVNDGHHRLVVAVLAGERRIPAWVLGPEAIGEWLVGERKEWPL